ncbi:MAG: cobalt ECF transporter T component CbiQ [Acidimicrobiales bacterium]
MGAGHGGTQSLAIPGNSLLHRLPPEVKIAATVVFVFAVVSTPRGAFWAFATHAGLILVAAVIAGVPLGVLLRRLRIELPFVGFAFFLPIVGTGVRVDVLGLPLSQAGLWGAWNILAKGTLGVSASIVLAATTPVPDLVRGLERLRLPKVLVAITGFMVRYLDVIAGEASRMHIARQSRGYEPRWIWQACGLASSVGILFVRSFERGRGAPGHAGPGLHGHDAHVRGPPRDRRRLGTAALVPLGAVVIAVAANLL